MRCPGQVLLLLLLPAGLQSAPQQPNVLFIVADDLGRSNTYCYDCLDIGGIPGWNDVSWHNPNIHSPVLEQLAGGGVLLDQVWYRYLLISAPQGLFKYLRFTVEREDTWCHNLDFDRKEFSDCDFIPLCL